MFTASLSTELSSMPLTRISLRRGKPAAYRRAVADNVYAAMRETFEVPDDDRFMVVSEHEQTNFMYDRRYLGIDRSDDLLIIQLTVSNTRTVEQKKALYRTIVQRLAKDPGVRPQDVLISLVEVGKENWSFGNGEAQYA
jgi:4-oxalocrotonate tautomerase